MSAQPLLGSDRLTVRETAVAVGACVATVHRWRSAGIRGRKLRFIRFGGKSFVLRSELESFLADLSDPQPAVRSDDPGLAERADAAGRKLAALGC